MDLQAQINKQYATLEALKASRATTRTRLTELEQQRPKHILAARAANDSAAQDALAKIDTESATLQRNYQDDGAAIEQMEENIRQISAAMKNAEIDAFRAETLKVINARSAQKLEARAEQLFEQLEQVVEAIVASDREIIERLKRLADATGLSTLSGAASDFAASGDGSRMMFGGRDPKNGAPYLLPLILGIRSTRKQIIPVAGPYADALRRAAAAVQPGS